MFFKKKNMIRIGRIEKELNLCRRFGNVRWRWRRSFFRNLGIDLTNGLNQHVMITGESGSGKSNVCKLILKRLSECGAYFLVLDPHSEYVEDANEFGAKVYDASMHSVNPFDLDGLTERERTAEVTGMFRRIFHLGEVQAYTLYKCIAYTYKVCDSRGRTPNIHDLVYTIRVFKKHSASAEENTLEALEKRLLVITGENFARNVSIDAVMRSRSIFALSHLHMPEAQVVYIESMLKKIYSMMLSGNKGPGKFYIVIDEAEKLQSSAVVARLVAEGRKYGIGMIAISQRVKALDKEIRSNTSTVIAFSQKEPEEQNYVANLIAGGNEYNRFMEVRKALRNLGRGQALVQAYGIRNPVVVSCQKHERDSRDSRYRIMDLARCAISKNELFGALQKEGFERETIMNDMKKLVDEHMLEYHMVQDDEYSGVWYISMPRNSAEHDIMVNLISRHLANNGIRNRIYNNAYGPDIIAFKGRERYAVEYETGLKDDKETQRMLESRIPKYQGVIVVSKDEVANHHV
ncbi:MAG: ATP-binding protein [Candidatus Micrarchaeales archaeon]|jgi:hypothetical protein